MISFPPFLSLLNKCWHFSEQTNIDYNKDCLLGWSWDERDSRYDWKVWQSSTDSIGSYKVAWYLKWGKINDFNNICVFCLSPYIEFDGYKGMAPFYMSICFWSLICPSHFVGFHSLPIYRMDMKPGGYIYYKTLQDWLTFGYVQICSALIYTLPPVRNWHPMKPCLILFLLWYSCSHLTTRTLFIYQSMPWLLMTWCLPGSVFCGGWPKMVALTGV